MEQYERRRREGERGERWTNQDGTEKELCMRRNIMYTNLDENDGGDRREMLIKNKREENILLVEEGEAGVEETLQQRGRKKRGNYSAGRRR